MFDVSLMHISVWYMEIIFSCLTSYLSTDMFNVTIEDIILRISHT